MSKTKHYYALFGKNNALASDLLCSDFAEAEAIRNNILGPCDTDLISIWKVTLKKENKVKSK